MTQGKRFGLSAVRKRDMWRRWKAGRSLHEIGRAFGTAFVDSLFGVASWWVRPLGPAALAANAYIGRAKGHLSRECFRFLDS
jgi:hypothetical protein